MCEHKPDARDANVFRPWVHGVLDARPGHERNRGEARPPAESPGPGTPPRDPAGRQPPTGFVRTRDDSRERASPASERGAASRPPPDLGSTGRPGRRRNPAHTGGPPARPESRRPRRGTRDVVAMSPRRGAPEGFIPPRLSPGSRCYGLRRAHPSESASDEEAPTGNGTRTRHRARGRHRPSRRHADPWERAKLLAGGCREGSKTHAIRGSDPSPRRRAAHARGHRHGLRREGTPTEDRVERRRPAQGHGAPPADPGPLTCRSGIPAQQVSHVQYGILHRFTFRPYNFK